MHNKNLYNKVWLLKQLRLPQDIIEEISSCCFYDKVMVDIKNKKQMFLRSLTSPLISLRFEDGYRFLLIDKSKKTFESTNCQNCGDYGYATSQIPANIRCHCYRRFIFIDDGLPTIEDIIYEEEEYKRYREDRASMLGYQ